MTTADNEDNSDSNENETATVAMTFGIGHTPDGMIILSFATSGLASQTVMFPGGARELGKNLIGAADMLETPENQKARSLQIMKGNN